jgi:hypothetical protein
LSNASLSSALSLVTLIGLLPTYFMILSSFTSNDCDRMFAADGVVSDAPESDTFTIASGVGEVAEVARVERGGEGIGDSGRPFQRLAHSLFLQTALVNQFATTPPPS